MCFAGAEADAPELELARGILDLRMRNVWLSDGHTLGKLHMDEYDNFLCQVKILHMVFMYVQLDRI